jgi:hypothetical protein
LAASFKGLIGDVSGTNSLIQEAPFSDIKDERPTSNVQRPTSNKKQTSNTYLGKFEVPDILPGLYSVSSFF